MTSQGLQPQISTIRAYFPGDPRAFHAEIQEISDDTDLASMRVDMKDLKRPVLAIETGKDTALSGQPIILMGYATGLAAILARTDEQTAQEILKNSGSDVSQMLDELAQAQFDSSADHAGSHRRCLARQNRFRRADNFRRLRRPLFNRQGKVIGVTYAILKGFGGSNFGIPIRFSQPLLGK